MTKYIYLRYKLSIIFRGKISHAYHKLLAYEIMRPLQQRIVFCNFLFILSLLLTQRVSTLQEMHRYFVLNEYVTFRQRNGRRAWAWPRAQNWFKVLLANRDMDTLWKMHFRVTRPTFNGLCDLVRGDLQNQHTRMRSPVSVEETVVLALWRLATAGRG